MEETSNEQIAIPFENLQEGFEISKRQIELLLESSNILSSENKFSIALTLTILAREELSKLDLIENCIDKRINLSKKEWMKITKYGSHKEKLQGLIKNAKKRVEESGPEVYKWTQDNIEKFGYGEIKNNYEDAVKIDPSISANLGIMNFIKQDSWYLDWNWENSSWKILTKMFDKKQIESMAYITLIGTEFLFYTFIFINRHSRFLMGESSTTLQKERDHYKLKSDEMKNIMYSSMFKRKKSVDILFLKNILPRKYSNIALFYTRKGTFPCRH